MKYPQSALRDQATDGGQGGGTATMAPPSDVTGVFDTSPAPAAPTQPTAPVAPVQPVAQPAAAPVAQPTAPQAQHLTPQQIAELSASAADRVLRASQPTPQAPRMSQEEFDKTFNVYKADAAGFKAITGYDAEKPEQITALNNAFQAVTRQALTMADAMASQKIEALKAELMGELSPVKTAHQAQFEKQLRDDFFIAHADLKDFGPLVETVAAGIKASGQKFSSKDELFKFAADKTRSLLPASVLQQTAAPQGGAVTPQTQQPTTQRRMTTVSTGGQVSAGQASAAPQNDAKTIFG